VSGLEHNGEPVCTLDLVGSSAHTLLVLTGDQADSRSADTAIARLVRFKGTVNSVTVVGPSKGRGPSAVADPHLAAHRRYRARRGQLLLVRPDGYLARRAPLNRPDTPERYLRQLIDGASEESPPPNELTPRRNISRGRPQARMRTSVTTEEQRDELANFLSPQRASLCRALSPHTDGIWTYLGLEICSSGGGGID
jgi:hypothetical protein